MTGMKAPDRPPTELDANAPPFLTASFSSATAAVVPGAPERVHAHGLVDLAHAVADARGGGQREVHDAERDAQALGHFAADQLAGARDAEGGVLDLLGNVVERAVRLTRDEPVDGALDHAGPADADVDDALRFTRRPGRRRP